MPVFPKMRGVPQLPLYRFTWSLSRSVGPPLVAVSNTTTGWPSGTTLRVVGDMEKALQSLDTLPTAPAQGSYTARPTKV
jgi:hypothetical protein